MESTLNALAGWATSEYNSICSTKSPVSPEKRVVTSNSSISRTASSEDILQANSSEDVLETNSHRDIQHLAFVRRQDGAATHTDSTNESKFRCPITGCENKGFRFEKDLRRHMKTTHDPNAEVWYCGCCQNLGCPDEGQKRRDKILGHLRQKHEASRSGDKKFASIECPVDDCHMLFTARSCLDIHLAKYHPGQSQGIQIQPNRSVCECSKKAEARSLLDSYQPGTNKHSAELALEPAAKRGKHGTETYQGLELPPLTNGYHASQLAMRNSWPDTIPYDMNPPSLNIDIPVNGMNETQNSVYYIPQSSWDLSSYDQAHIDGLAFSDTGRANAYQHMNQTHLPNTQATPATHPEVGQFCLDEGGLVDLLAIRDSQEFKKWVSDLRFANGGLMSAHMSPVAYNPKTETIILTSFSVEAIERVTNGLQNLLATRSKRWGSKYLKKSPPDLQYEPSRSLADNLSVSSEQCSSISEPEKMFPIKPKDHRRLVGAWFKDILPALPDILSGRIGEDYTVSLVRRGQYDIRAKPCIEIESPRIPGPKAQGIIQKLLDGICAEVSQESIPVRFSQGRIRKLLGRSDNDGNNNAQEDRGNQRYFNMARPYSKPRMGASLGLLCSNKVIGTLGGYVYVDNEKYMLTSEHFITKSQQPENRDPEYRDSDDQDLETLISPSRLDLCRLEGNLKQTLRDLRSELPQHFRNIYGDRDIPEDDLSGLLTQSPKVAQDLNAIKRVETLLDQVRRPTHEYAIGSVSRRSLEPRNAPLPKSLEGIVRLDDGENRAKYHMDWALCKVNPQASESSENRHKYRSESDARADNYTEEIESELKYQPGDLCHQTCGVETGTEVYYVGQGSGFRSGSVNLPTLVSRGGDVTLDWAIIKLDGQKLPYSHVEGDSGAWVIKRNGNMLMGQVHSYTSGQVLFTPIDVIFDDIKRDCGVEVRLPPRSVDPGPTAQASPLCAIPSTPPIEPFEFLKPRKTASAITAEKLPVATPVMETQNLEPSNTITGESDTVNERNEVVSSTPCDLLPALPSLMDASQSWGSSSGLPESVLPLDETEPPYTQANLKRLQSKSQPNSARTLVVPAIPHLALDEQHEAQRLDLAPYKFQFRTRSQVPRTLSMRSPSWPAVKESKVTKTQKKSRLIRFQLSLPFPTLSNFSSRDTLLAAMKMLITLKKYQAFPADRERGHS